MSFHDSKTACEGLGAGLVAVTEQGGLIWGAYQHSDGSVESHGLLSFDQYEENQIFALDAGREGDEKFSRITIADQGNYPVSEKREAFRRIMNLPRDEQEAAWNRFFAAHPAYDTKRLVLGRATDGSIGLDLKDASGRSRVVLSVQSDWETCAEVVGRER